MTDLSERVERAPLDIVEYYIADERSGIKRPYSDVFTFQHDHINYYGARIERVGLIVACNIPTIKQRLFTDAALEIVMDQKQYLERSFSAFLDPGMVQTNPEEDILQSLAEIPEDDRTFHRTLPVDPPINKTTGTPLFVRVHYSEVLENELKDLEREILLHQVLGRGRRSKHFLRVGVRLLGMKIRSVV